MSTQKQNDATQSAPPWTLTPRLQRQNPRLPLTTLRQRSKTLRKLRRPSTVNRTLTLRTPFFIADTWPALAPVKLEPQVALDPRRTWIAKKIRSTRESPVSTSHQLHHRPSRWRLSKLRQTRLAQQKRLEDATSKGPRTDPDASLVAGSPTTIWRSGELCYTIELRAKSSADRSLKFHAGKKRRSFVNQTLSNSALGSLQSRLHLIFSVFRPVCFAGFVVSHCVSNDHR